MDKQVIPVRLQLSRKKGFKLISPNGLPIVVVSRPSKWGNPFEVGTVTPGVGLAVPDRATAVLLYTDLVIRHDRLLEAEAVLSLRGKNLACWCGVCEKHRDGKPLLELCSDCEPCHADVLLAIANS